MTNQHHNIYYPIAQQQKESRLGFNYESSQLVNTVSPPLNIYDQKRPNSNANQNYYNPSKKQKNEFNQLKQKIADYYGQYIAQQKSPQPQVLYQQNSISPQPPKILPNNYSQSYIPYYENSQSTPQSIFSESSLDTSTQNGLHPWKVDKELDKVIQYILQLRDPEKREAALSELSKKRESFTNLAPLLWTSIGTIAIFLQEIAQIYTCLSPPNLNPNQSSRICNVLGLLQCLALHQQTRSYFLKAHLPLFLYPYLNTSNKSKAFENLRVTSLGVIGALVKGDDTDAINFLMQTEIIPLCLRIMKKGQELSRTVATFIVQKILLDDNGLHYICETPERFFAVSTVLQNMIDDLLQNGKDDQRLLRHIIRCYLRLSENNKAGEVLKKYLPNILKDPSQQYIKDEIVKKWHLSLLKNLSIIPSDSS